MNFLPLLIALLSVALPLFAQTNRTTITLGNPAVTTGSSTITDSITVISSLTSTIEGTIVTSFRTSTIQGTTVTTSRASTIQSTTVTSSGVSTIQSTTVTSSRVSTIQGTTVVSSGVSTTKGTLGTTGAPSATKSSSAKSTDPQSPTKNASSNNDKPSTTSKEDEMTTKVVTTTYPAITASVSGKPVTIAYSGEVVPLRTTEAQQPAPSSFTDEIISELSKQEDITAFTGLLEQAPELLRSLDPAKKYRFYAPTNEFVATFLANNGQPETPLSRRKVYVPPSVGQQIVEQPAGEPDFNHIEYTLVTVLKGEIIHVNLGDGEGARVVSLPAQLQDPPGNEGEVQIISGEGNKTTVKPDTIEFKYGVIQKTDGFFHLPQNLKQTFAATMGNKFAAALNDSGMLQDLSNTQKVTVFAVQDSGFTGTPDEQQLKRHVVKHLAYSPELSDGLCLETQGGSILTVAQNGKDRFVNGAKIVRSNVIANNGVVHYLDKFAEKGRDGGCAAPSGGDSRSKSGAVSKGVSLAALGAMVNAALYIVG